MNMHRAYMCTHPHTNMNTHRHTHAQTYEKNKNVKKQMTKTSPHRPLASTKTGNQTIQTHVKRKASTLTSHKVGIWLRPFYVAITKHLRVN